MQSLILLALLAGSAIACIMPQASCGGGGGGCCGGGGGGEGGCCCQPPPQPCCCPPPPQPCCCCPPPPQPCCPPPPCCGGGGGGCGGGCRKKREAIESGDPNSLDEFVFGSTGDSLCNSARLRKILNENMRPNPTESKERIVEAAGTNFAAVVCSENSLLVSMPKTGEFCSASLEGTVCQIFG